MSAQQSAESHIADMLENASAYLRHETPDHAQGDWGRWEAFQALMAVVKDLRPHVPNPVALVMLLDAKLGPQLRGLGFNPASVLSELVDSVLGPRLVGAVLVAQQTHEAARRAPQSTSEAVTDEDGRGLALVTVGALLERPVTRRRWLVDGLLLAGGLSLLAAKPKAGKSTLARCLCVAVAQNEPWLGREVCQGTVIYLGLEEKPEEVSRHLRTLRADPASPLYLFLDLPPVDGLERLRESVEAKRPALVVVDGLYRLVRVNDESGYAEVYAKLAPLLALARESGAHVLMTHHEGKRAHGLDGQDGVLGSTALVGSVDATLVIRRARDSGRRTIQSTMRYGTDLEESVLEMDESGLVTLGGTRSEAETDGARDRILEALGRNGPCPEKSSEGRDGLRSLVTGVRTVVLTKALRQLWESEKVTRTGSGRRGEPYLYDAPRASECGPSGSHLHTGTCKPESGHSGAAFGGEL